MRLSELKSGEHARIVYIAGSGSLRRRLTEMGFVRGTEIQVIKNAPLRDPIEYKIMGYEVSLRRREAATIEVEIPNQGDGPLSPDRDDINQTTDSQKKENINNVKDYRRADADGKKVIKVALVGNPNSGKTTLFNFISGLNEHTGNYSGVTVDSKIAVVEHEGHTIEIADLPGTYSLSAFSPEERFVRDYIINEHPDYVINVVDVTNLERNLYLTTQLLEIEQPTILALNMYDEFRESGDQLNVSKLGQLLALPVIPTVGRRGHGVAQILDKIVNYRPKPLRRVGYNPEVERLVERVTQEIEPINKTAYPDRYVAIKLVEANERLVEITPEQNRRLEKATQKINNIYNIYKEDIETLMAGSRYAFIKGALKETFEKSSDSDRKSKSLKIDSILTNKYVGLPIFFAMLWVVFYATFTLGEYPMGWIEQGVGYVKGVVEGLMSDGAVKDLIVSGVIDGVGSVIVFLPNILILFFFISLMEDTGYMARAAFITDKLMHKIGLHGKSFIPLIIGFGCNVPAVMATRTIENRQNRLQTMLITPFMSCSARLPIYILITGTFFAENAANILFLIYMAGIILAIASSLLLRKTLFRGKEVHFVMELPPYRIPTALSTVKHMWNKGQQYLQKMGGIILISVVIIWALGYYPTQGGKYEGESYLEQVGKAVEPVVEPLGFNWRMGIGLISGVAAKEIIVSSMSVIYDTEGNLGERLKTEVDDAGKPVWTTAVALSFLSFVLIYFPCVAVVSAIRRESGSWKWALFMVAYTTSLAWIVSFIVYRIAS